MMRLTQTLKPQHDAVDRRTATTENKVAFSRQAFNDQVTEYNTYRAISANTIRQHVRSSDHAELLEFEDSAEIQLHPRYLFNNAWVFSGQDQARVADS